MLLDQMDLKTLMASNMLLVFFMSLVLLFYRMNYKTYTGFEFWLTSTVILAVGYITFFFRGATPGLLMVVVSNSAIVLAFLLRLEGIVGFIYGRRILRRYYFLPVIVIPFLIYFYLGRNNIALRSLTVGIACTIIVIMIALEFFRNMTVENRNLYLAIGLLHVICGLMIIGRAILWVADRQYNFSIDMAIQQLFFMTTIIFEVGFGISFLMLNNKRTEADLVTSKNDLQASVDNLEKAISEVKTLKGMIPICMHCKEIRDDKGYWSELEKFIADHTEAEFSHSICDKCLEKYHSK